MRRAPLGARVQTDAGLGFECDFLRPFGIGRARAQEPDARDLSAILDEKMVSRCIARLGDEGVRNARGDRRSLAL